MLWSEIRDLVVERMGEYQAGAAEAEAGATLTNATVYRRLTQHFREMLGEAFAVKPTRVGVRASMLYTANSESVALATAAKWRPLSLVSQLLGDGVSYEPLQQLTEFQERRYLETGSLGLNGSYGYRIESDSIWVIPKPSGNLTLRYLYLPEYTAVTVADAVTSPSYIPTEHHGYLALRVAMSFLNEAQKNATLNMELAQGEAKFLKWAAADPKTGPSFVHEND